MEALVNCSQSKWKWFITIFQARWIPRFHWKEGEECLTKLLVHPNRPSGIHCLVLQICNHALRWIWRELYSRHQQNLVILTLRLKKKGMDLNEPSSFRPISNLSFLSKVLEKIVAKQLVLYLTETDLLPKFQSGYRRYHSTETLLVRLLSDIHSAIASGEVAVLALLDV